MALTSATLKINMAALKHNLDQFVKCLKPNTKIMIMIKACAYGLSSGPIAQWAQETGVVDYLAVACVTEGVDLRRSTHI